MNKILSLLVVVQVLFCQAVFTQRPVLLPEKDYVVLHSNLQGDIIHVTVRPIGYTKTESPSRTTLFIPFRKGELRYSEKRGIAIFGDSIKVIKQGTVQKYYVKEKLTAAFNGMTRKDGFYTFVFGLSSGEKIFGGGERALPMDRRGYRFNLYNNPWYGYEYGADNLNFSVPFFISSKGYGLFFDNGSKGFADIGKLNNDILEVGFISGELQFYIIPGNTPAEILQSYTRLTGTQPIPPRWAFGNFMSRFGYRSETQVKDIYTRMKADSFPIDAVIFDLFWFGDSIKGTMGNLDWMNKEKWPDPARMINDFKKEDIKTILITEPFILKGTPNYDTSKQWHAVDSSGKPYVLKDFYFGEGGLLDIFTPHAQYWFWSKYDKQIRQGVAGWWGDLGEPEKHPADMYHDLSVLGYGRKFSADEVHNLYAHYWSKMLHEMYEKNYPDVRLFHLNRSGFAGSQRYSIFPWTGDVHRNWNGFKAQLPILLGMSLCGIPYIHSDAGGFAMGEKDPELYTRWLQFAAFTPVFRPHGTAFGDIDTTVKNIESEPVFYPQPYKDIVRGAIQFRYALTPYNYTLAYQQHTKGHPLMRPMFYHYYNDAEAYNANDQYLWGEDILVAPVFEKRATEKKLYLPGGRWYNFISNVFDEGGKWITVDARMIIIPFFIREGAFIPMMHGLKNMEQYSTRNLQVWYVPSQKTSKYTLYDDDGKTNKPIEKKQFELLEFTGNAGNKQISISVKSNGGNFTDRPDTRKIEFAIPGQAKAPASVMLNNKQLKVSKEFNRSPQSNTFFFDKKEKLLHIYVEFQNKPLHLAIK